MKLLRFISKEEFNVLNRDKKVKPTNKGRAWDGKKRLYAFPLGNYPEEEYFKIKEYLEVAYNIDYDYAVYIDNGHEEYITFAAYDKEMLEMTLGRKASFDVDEDAYDSGPVYVVPEVRLVEYSLDDVEKVVNINSKIKESTKQMQTSKYNSYAKFIKAWRENLISNVDGYREIIEEVGMTEDSELEYSKMPVSISYYKFPIISDGIASVKVVYLSQADNFVLITPENVYDVYTLLLEDPSEIKAVNIGLQLSVDSAGFDTDDAEFQKLIQKAYIAAGNSSPAFELSSAVKADVEDKSEEEESEIEPSLGGKNFGDEIEQTDEMSNKGPIFKEPKGFEADEEITKNMEGYSKFSNTTKSLHNLLENIKKSPAIVSENVYAKYLGESNNVLMLVVDNKSIYRSFINMPKKAKDTLTKFGESIRLNKDTQIVDSFVKDGKRAFVIAEYVGNNFWVVEGETPLKESIYNKRIVPKEVITLKGSSVRAESRKFRLIDDSGSKKIFSFNSVQK